MIKEILSSRLLVGFIIDKKKITKTPLNYVEGFKTFKVDKRSDGWIEIFDIQSSEKWAIFKRFSFFGYLYLGFGLDKRPFAFYIPNSFAKKDIRNAVRKIKKKYRFLKIDWTLRGGSITGRYYHIQTEIIDLFSFINFLKPIPEDIKKIVSKIEYPKKSIQRLYGQVYNILNCKHLYVLKSNLLKSNHIHIYREVLSLYTASVLRVRRIVSIEVKYQVHGGYIPSNTKLGVIKNIKFGVIKNVWSKESTLIQNNLQGGLKILSTRKLKIKK